MNRHIFKKITILFVLLTLIFSVSCKQGLDTGKMLDFLSGAREYDLIFHVGDTEYPMHLSLEENDSSAVRDGSAVITDGVLEGVRFEMSDGALKMLVGELEYPLEEKNSSALYLLFSAFAIKEDGFVGATQEKESDVLVARYNGKHEFTLTLYADTYEPVKIEAEGKGGICSLDFVTIAEEG